MADKRTQAADILKVVPEPPAEIYSDGPTAALFTKLTGTTHAALVANWAGGGIMTCCNGFVGWYGQQLGSPTYLGGFDLEKIIGKLGKKNAWVKSTADVRPKYGDICRHTAFHVGISLDFDGDKWKHADAGQGGKRAGHDIIKRTYSKTAYDYTKLQGWIDIDLYFAPATPTGPIPAWLPGWWKVNWRMQDYYYYFDQNWQVKWTQTQPTDKSQPPLLANDTGSVVLDLPSTLTIRWGKSGTVEKFNKPVDSDQQLQGKWNDTEPIRALKL